MSNAVKLAELIGVAIISYKLKQYSSALVNLLV